MANWVPFGGTRVPSAAVDVLLQNLCYVYHTGEAQRIQNHLDVIAMLAAIESERPAPPGRKRWWRWSRATHVSYLCIDPKGPGFRLVPPEDTDAYIEDVPSAFPSSHLAAMAREALAVRATYSNRIPPEASGLHTRLRSALAPGPSNGDGAFEREMTRYSRALQRGTAGSPQQVQATVNRIFEACLFGAGTHNQHFASAQALLELQARSNLWLKEDAYHQPRAYLKAYLESGQIPYQLIDRVGTAHLAEGRKTAREALKIGCMWRFHQNLALALFHYGVAHQLSELNPQPLSYSTLVAEESWVCTFTGIASACQIFFGDAITSHGETLGHEMRHDPAGAKARFLRQYSSEFFPIIPRPLAHCIVAHAEVVADPARHHDLQSLRTAVDQLNSSHSTGIIFNQFVGTSLLLAGAKMIGLSDEVQRQATRLAGLLVVDQHIR